MNRASTAILIGVLAAFAGCSSDPPTDSAVKQTFVANKPTFQKLHQMIQEDRATQRIGDDVVGDDWFKTSGSTLDDALAAVGLTRERYDEYMTLLGQIDAYRVSVDLYDESKSTIGIFRSGNVAESHSVDVVFAPNSPNPVVADTVAATISDNTSAYLELGHSWYIYREHD